MSIHINCGNVTTGAKKSAAEGIPAAERIYIVVRSGYHDLDLLRGLADLGGDDGGAFGFRRHLSCGAYGSHRGLGALPCDVPGAGDVSAQGKRVALLEADGEVVELGGAGGSLGIIRADSHIIVHFAAELISLEDNGVFPLAYREGKRPVISLVDPVADAHYRIVGIVRREVSAPGLNDGFARIAAAIVIRKVTDDQRPVLGIKHGDLQVHHPGGELDLKGALLADLDIVLRVASLIGEVNGGFLSAGQLGTGDKVIAERLGV